MFVFYQIFVALYSLGIRIASLFNLKARQWIVGRRQIVTRMEREVVTDSPLVWFHCASLGEFEQGRPVMEALKVKYPEIKILLTFFSPSGYEVQKKYKGADWVYYLPADNYANARRLVNHISPALVVFVKYEFWFNYLKVLHKKKVPTLFISVIFRPSQYFFSRWATWFRKQLRKVSFFFVQDTKSAELLKSIGVHQYAVSGDTRFDRVASLALKSSKFEKVTLFKESSSLIIGGSTWPVDEQMLLRVLQKAPETIKLVLAPHLVDSGHIDAILHLFTAYNPVLYTEIDGEVGEGARVLIVNTIGMLSQLYQYADLAYVGGGFGVGIHNLPEAAAFGVPVVFGPNHERFKEAMDLKALGAGYAVSSTEEGVDRILYLIQQESLLEKSGNLGREYIQKHAGATSMVIKRVEAFLS